MKITNFKKIAARFLTIFTFIFGLTAAANAAVNPELISQALNGNVSNGNSRNYSVGGDGRYIVFESSATNLVSGITDTNEGTDVFLRDMQTGTTRCLSCVGTATANSFSYNPIITPDGRYVVFGTRATDLVGGIDINNDGDVIYIDTQTNERKLVSATPSGAVTGNSYSGLAINGRAYDMSDDGRYVVFMSNASDLTNINDPNMKTDIFVRDMQLNFTRLVTASNIGNTGNNYSSDPSISADGNIISFTSAANDLTPNDNNNVVDVFVYNYEAQVIRCASMSTRTDIVASGSRASYNATVSKDGSRVAYFTDANDLTNIRIPFGDPYTNVVVYDLGLNHNSLATVNVAGNASANNTSGIGNLFRFNITISANGRYVTFETRATNLSSTPTDSSYKVVRRDLTRGVTEIVSLKPSGAAATQNTFAGLRAGAMSRDGRFVVFYGAADLAPDFPGSLGGQQVYVRDMLNGITTALTLKYDGNDLSAIGGGEPIITPNGKTVVYSSAANDLTPTTLNGQLNVFKAAVPAPQKASADFDGDGRTDFTVFRPSNGSWYFLNNSATFASYRIFGTATDKLVPADYTGDGRTDYAVFRPSNGTWYISDGLTFNETTAQFGQSGDKPVPQDYDGDGKDDLAVYRAGTWWWLGSRTGQATAYQFGLADDVPVIGDYDGDGKADYAVFRPSNGTWYIRKSSNGTFIFFSFGQTGDKPVAADYDGDGRTDIAVYRGGVWYIQRSLTNSISIIQFGLATDIPSAGSFDADGKADIAVWRPSSGDWYVLRSTTNSLLGVHYGQSGDAPVSSAYLQ